MIMPDRKKAAEILIIIIGGAYLLYRIFAPKMDVKETSSGFLHSAAGCMPANAKTVGLKEVANKAAEADHKLKNGLEPARDIFQKPNEFFTFDAKAGSGAAPKAQDIKLSLEGTIWGPDKKVAILSGIVVAEGDIIQGGKVIRIEPDRVIIFKNGVELEIKRGA